MIILKEIIEADNKLQEILTLTTVEIQNKSVIDKTLLKLSGSAFEKIVCDTLNSVSKDSTFYNRFEQATVHAFPDIYARILENNWFGVEVKTSQGDWKCFGNSIFESIRVPNLDDRIYVFFGKFSSISLECKWAKYDECVDNINITHSPRYQINMDIKGDPKLSIFSKMSTTYLHFSSCSSAERMDYLRKFKRNGLGRDVALWWLPEHEGPTLEDEKKLIIRLFSELPIERRNEIRNAAMVLFPEIFSKSNKKYSRILPWLASQYGVVMGNLRDAFTSGGKWDLLYNGVLYRLPKVCYYINAGQEQIKVNINNLSDEDLIYGWELTKVSFESFDEKVSYWIEKLTDNLLELPTMPKDFPVKPWLKSIFL